MIILVITYIHLEQVEAVDALHLHARDIAEGLSSGGGAVSRDDERALAQYVPPVTHLTFAATQVFGGLGLLHVWQCAYLSFTPQTHPMSLDIVKFLTPQTCPYHSTSLTSQTHPVSLDIVKILNPRPHPIDCHTENLLHNC